MEILQTLLTVLVNNNDTLTLIFSVLFSAIEIYLYMLIISVLLKVKLSYKKQFLFVILLVSIGGLTSSFIPSPYYTIINLLLTVILSIITFKVSILKAIFSTFCFYSLTFFTNIIWALVYTFIFNCSTKVLNQVLIYRVIFSISTYITYYIFYKLCDKFSFSINTFTRLRHHKLVIFNLIIGLLTIVLQLLSAFLYFDYIPPALNIFNFTVSIAYFLISIFSLYRTNKLEITRQLLEEEKLYNKTLNTLYDNIRGFKHDFNNIVQAIGGYVSTNNMEALKLYYKDLLDDCQLNNNLSALNPEIINNPAVYSLLTDKYYKARNLEIKINLEIFDDLSCLNIKTYELVRILGILLDNSIEASSKTSEKLVNVTFRKDKKVDRNLIIIKNTYENKNIDIDRIFEKGYTSKSDEDKSSHGLGLWEVRKYLRKNTNLNLYTTKDNNYFVQQLEIYNN